MSPAGIASNGERFKYQRHRPEQTLLYQLVERHYDEFQSLLVDHILPMVDMRQWVISFPFQLRFLFAHDLFCK